MSKFKRLALEISMQARDICASSHSSKRMATTMSFDVLWGVKSTNEVCKCSVAFDGNLHHVDFSP